MAGDNGLEYNPSQPAAIVFAALYGLMCIFTIAQYIYYKCWFWFFAVLASIMEAVGFAAKAASASGSFQREIYIVQYVLILIAPAVMAAACYMCMGRIALYVTPPKYRTMKVLWVIPRFMTPVFVTCDILAFLIQVFGGVMATSTDPSVVKNGFNVLKAGLAIQIVAFGFFLIISFRFHIISRSYRSQWPSANWVTLLWAINGASTVIFLRSLYRLVEFAMGFDGYLYTHEWTFYAFDAALILLGMTAFNVWHPARFLGNIGWKQTDGGWQERETSREFDLDGDVGDGNKAVSSNSVDGIVTPRELA